MRLCCLAVAVSAAALAMAAPAAENPKIMFPALVPAPAQLQLKDGSFILDARTVIVAAPDTQDEARELAAALRSSTGFELPVVGKAEADACLALQLKPDLATTLGTEGYLLRVTSDRVVLTAATPAGLFYAGVTLRQLLPPQIFSSTAVKAVAWAVPCLEIQDVPLFPWRGLLLDPARHFWPPEFVKKMIDLMALHKLNTLQLHLTDDQGWRLEIRRYPGLTEIGSLRKESPLKGNRRVGDGKPYGPFFYTQAQIRELVAYARKRHVTLVPEIEMPGHFLAALAAYPQYSCRGGPFAVRTQWGIEPDILCVGNDEALTFVENILAEVTELFPDRFIHIGGDEAPRLRWKTCPKCQARLKAAGFKSEAQLQTWFNHRVETYLKAQGRRMIGWDEILEGGLTPGAAVMSWRGIKGGIEAAEAGHDVVMSPTTHCYFDYAQSRGAGEPENIGGHLPLKTVYLFEPVPGKLAADRRPHILGAQGNLWAEYLWTPRDVEYMAFPRAAALAEVTWSPVEKKDFGAFVRRLEVHLRRLDQWGVRYRPLDPAETLDK